MGKCVNMLILLVALAVRSAHLQDPNSFLWAKTPMVEEFKENYAASERDFGLPGGKEMIM